MYMPLQDHTKNYLHDKVYLWTMLFQTDSSKTVILNIKNSIKILPKILHRVHAYDKLVSRSYKIIIDTKLSSWKNLTTIKFQS